MPKEKNIDIPLNDVINMRKKGLQNHEIAKQLQQSDFQPEQISDAFNQADIKSSMGDIPPGLSDAPSPSQESSIEEMPTFNPSYVERAPQQETQQFAPPMTFQQETHQQGFAPEPVDRANYNIIEQIAESIVQEKWDNLSSGIGDIRIWKEKTDSDILSVKQEIIRTQQRLENIQKAVLGKISEYNESMEGVSSDIKALEKVFEKIIEPLTRNIKELDKITKGLKKK